MTVTPLYFRQRSSELAFDQGLSIAITHRSSRPPFARRVFERVEESPSQQDNEQWHLLILEELIWVRGQREGFVRYNLLPQVIAFTCHRISWILYVLRPEWSYASTPTSRTTPSTSTPCSSRRTLTSSTRGTTGCSPTSTGGWVAADLFRQIGHDERRRKEESLDRIAGARLS